MNNEKSTSICTQCTDNNPAEWVDEFCQECWEDYCETTWLERMAVLGKAVSGE